MPEYNKSGEPLIIAHRGYSAIAPENTLASIKAAIKNNFRMIEIDIRLTKDNELIVIHDQNIARVSNGKGMVGSLELSELRQYDFGSWFAPEFKCEIIPTLREVFEICRNNIQIDLEIKIPAFFSRYDMLIKRLLALIDEYKMREYVFISSFNKKLLKRIKEKDKTIPLAFLADNYFTAFGSVKYACEYNMKGLIYNHELITRELIKKVNKNGMFIYTYTINEQESMNLLKGMKIDGIITNGFPGFLG